MLSNYSWYLFILSVHNYGIFVLKHACDIMVSIICMMYSDFSFHTFILVIVYVLHCYVKYCEDVVLSNITISCVDLLICVKNTCVTVVSIKITIKSNLYALY